MYVIFQHVYILKHDNMLTPLEPVCNQIGHVIAKPRLLNKM